VQPWRLILQLLPTALTPLALRFGLGVILDSGLGVVERGLGRGRGRFGVNEGLKRVQVVWVKVVFVRCNVESGRSGRRCV